MAISFSQKNISSPEYNLYQIDKFNGVDYTTTPVSVDDSRATMISNYLPYGNALVKRNGWEVVNRFIYNGKKINVYNIFSFDKEFILYATYYNDNNILVSGIFEITHLEDSDRNYEIKILKGDGELTSDNYSYGVAFEGRLFILAMNDYLMIYDNGEELVCESVSNSAYVPLVLFGLGHKDDPDNNRYAQEQGVQIKSFNLLGNRAKIKIINYPEETTASTYTYEIAKSIGMTNRTITILKINDEDFVNGESYANIGTVTWDSINQELTISREAVINADDENVSYITLEFEYSKNNDEIGLVKKMRFGIPYGSYGYRDRLFLAGNPTYPNMDIHTGETADDETAEEWQDYTYFPDDSFRKFGTSNNVITGYGILSNGYMAIFMKQVLGEPNLYLRYFNMTVDSDGNYIEQFPVYVSGISIENVNNEQIIKYGNDLLINTPRGIYKMVVGDSTATQTYKTVEMSYFIRNNLGTNVIDSCHAVYEGKLYICRSDYTTDVNGGYNQTKRVYVADKDRYSFVDGKQVYEWWVLDGINAIKMFNLKDFSINTDISAQSESLYFIDMDKGLCKINTTKYDSYIYETDNVEINSQSISKEVFIDTNTNKIILDLNSKLIKDIMEKSKIEKYYNIFKDYYKISFDIPLLVKTALSNEEQPVIETTNNITTLTIYVDNTELLEYSKMYNFNIIYDDKIYSINEIRYLDNYLDNANLLNKIELNLSYLDDYSSVLPMYELGIIIPKNTKLSINEMYEKNNDYPLSSCKVRNNMWYYTDEYGNITEIGTEFLTYFNKFTLSFNKITLDIEIYNEEVFNKVIFYIDNPIESYWYGKHNALGRIDYLKTVDNITFIPETRNGGYTVVSYKTFNNEVNYITRATNQSFNFEEIDFDDWTFGGEAIAQSYSSKKKIKNFSFMQLKFFSNDEKNSTITSIAFRYKYTRKNKGVR